MDATTYDGEVLSETLRTRKKNRAYKSVRQSWRLPCTHFMSSDLYCLVAPDCEAVILLAAKEGLVLSSSDQFCRWSWHRQGGKPGHPGAFLISKTCWCMFGSMALLRTLVCVFSSPVLPPRNGRRGCRGAATGYRRTRPHVRHSTANTSAHGFVPSLLLFSTTDMHVSPSTRRVSQNLQILRFTAGRRRMLVFRDTERICARRRRDMP